jgi:hypothetical protein
MNELPHDESNWCGITGDLLHAGQRSYTVDGAWVGLARFADQGCVFSIALGVVAR